MGSSIIPKGENPAILPHPSLTYYRFLSIPVVFTWEFSVPTATSPGHRPSRPQGDIQPRNSFSLRNGGIRKTSTRLPFVWKAKAESEANKQLFSAD